jgi:hypothetical protein
MLMLLPQNDLNSGDMKTAPSPLEISVIVEWENVVLAQDEVSCQMLRALARECQNTSRVTELRFVFDPAIVGADDLRRLVDREFVDQGNCRNIMDLIYQPVSGLHYYDLKNEGAKASGKDIIVFCDSDVIPEPGWLSLITGPLFDDDGPVAVAGASYVKPDGLIGAAFAAGWFFPLPSDVKDAGDTSTFFANNVAFARSKFVERQFSKMPDGVTRGACVKLAQTIVQSGGRITFQPKAVVWHAPPNGIGHMVIRALAQGRDHFFIAGATTMPAKFSQLLKAVRHIATIGPRVRRRMKANVHTLGESGKMANRGAALMTAYYAFVAIGMGLTLIAPFYTRKAWRI